jgi:hypothetical protein
MVGEEGLPWRHDLLGNLWQSVVNLKEVPEDRGGHVTSLSIALLCKLLDGVDQTVKVSLAVTDRQKSDDVEQISEFDLHVEARTQYLTCFVASVAQVFDRDDESRFVVACDSRLANLLGSDAAHAWYCVKPRSRLAGENKRL